MTTKNFQTYRSLNKGDKENFAVNRYLGLTNVPARKLESYSNPVYVSDRAEVSRREVHTINKNTRDAYKKYHFSNLDLPKIVIVDQEELPGAFGLYDCVTNIVYYSSDIASKEGMKQNGGLGITEFHEMWHAKQADIFVGNGHEFSQNNKKVYIDQLRKDCKKRIDILGITADNVDEISVYASLSYKAGNWDEVEAEYQAFHRKG